MTKEKELFLKSHEILMLMAEWVGKPLYYLPTGSRTRPEDMKAGHTVYDEKPPQVIHAIPSELSRQVIEAFIDSHRLVKALVP